MHHEAQGVHAAGSASNVAPTGDSWSDNPVNGWRVNAYEYDAAGNRTSANESGQISQPTFDGENRHVSYGFDASGNVTTGVANQGIWNYAYDAYGQLLTATPYGASTPTARFVYDPRGRVCQRTVGGVTTNLYYAGGQLIEEDNAANGARGCSYVYGAGGERADRLNTDYSSTFYHYDGRGFVTHLSDSGGHGVEQYLYDAYGQPYVYDAGSGYRGQASAIFNNRSVWAGGYEWYPELGLYRCGARFYDPTCAHWLQPDPIGQAGGLNLYAYCHNDPINATDPSGLADPNHLDETPKKNYDFADPGMASLFGAQKGDQIGISSFGVQYSSGHWQDVPDTGGSSKDGRVTIIGHDPIWITNTFGGIGGFGANLIHDGLIRVMYDSASKQAPDILARQMLKTYYRQRTLGFGKAYVAAMLADRARKGQLPRFNNPRGPNLWVTKTGKIFAYSGGVMEGVNIGLEAYAVVNAPDGERGKIAAEAGGRLSGGFAGAAVGAEIGAFGGPVGAAVGALVGGGIGTWAGQSYIDSFMGN